MPFEPSEQERSVADNQEVLILDADYTDASVDAAVEQILESVPADVAGKTVLVKPNIAAPFKMHRAVTTHPALVRAVVKALERRNPKKIIVGDNPGATAYGINEKCARITGIRDAAGEHYVNFMKRPKPTEINSKHLDMLNISSEFFECDYFINLPKLKGHSHSYMTGAIKNLYGMCVGGEKSRLHVLGKNPRVFAEILVDVFTTRTPDLNIIDAVVCMEGNGPTNGTPLDVGQILASTNGFALDAVCAKMGGFNMHRIKTLEVGHERGLWSGDLDSIKIKGTVPKIRKFKPPQTFGAYTIFSRAMSPFISCLPRVREDSCKKCGVCASHCPVDACTFQEGEFPVIHKKKCIKCYCCQEFCPHDAIALNGRMLRLATRMAGAKREFE
jgi:uncharacterized protein (DUF362 family)/Pyruvate/2-oxoacid:ferredoxin oxidoreductase delta subunit